MQSKPSQRLLISKGKPLMQLPSPGCEYVPTTEAMGKSGPNRVHQRPANRTRLPRYSPRLQPWVRIQGNAIETVSTVSQSQEIKSSFGGNMAHALVRVFIHFVWSTKHGKRLLLGDSGEHVRNHIEEYAWQHSMGIVQLAVQPEHVHLLAPLSRTQPIEDIVGRIKGESSHWINQTNLIRSKFSWQTGYWAGSVCFQHVDQVKTYIQGQQEHHRVKSFREEFEEILRRDGYSEDQIAMLLEGVSR